MALQEVEIHTRLVGGLDTKTDPKAAPSTRLLDLRNGVFTKGGSIAKRNGFAALGKGIDGSASLYTNARAIATRDDELVLLCDGASYSYRPSSDTWSSIGAAPSVTVTEAPIARTGTMQTAVDHATSNGITVVAWEDSRGGVWWTVTEDSTGRELRPVAQLDANGQRPRCCPVGSVLHVYHAVPASGTVYVSVVNPASPTDSVTPAPLIIDLNATYPGYDVEPTLGAYDATNPAAIAWVETGGGYRVGYVHASGVLGSPATGLPTIATWSDVQGGPIAVAFDRISSTYIAVIWSGGTTLATQRPSYRIHPIASLGTSTHTGFLSPDTSAGGWVRCTGAFGALSGGNAQLWWAAELAGATDDHNITEGGVVDAGSGVNGHVSGARGHGLAARALQVGGRIYQTLVHPSVLFGYYAVVDHGGGLGAPQVVAARLLAGTAYGLPARTHLPSVHADGGDASATVHHVALPFRAQVPEAPGVFAETGLALSALDFADDQGWQTAQLGRCLYLGGGTLLQYDGRRWAEAGFHACPEITTPITSAASGAMTNSGVYGYICVYEEINAQGEIDRGTTAPEVLVTLGGGDDTATLTIPTCRLTGRQGVRIGVYRSLNGDSSAFFRVSSLDATTAGATNGYVANDTTVDTVTFVDKMSDADAEAKEELYTNGGVLPNDPAPTGRALAVGKNRLFFSDPGDPDLVRYSQQLADGCGVELADALAVRTPPYGGAVVALAVMDDAVVVLKETALYYIAGPGPAANPDADANAAFSDPVLITSDIGCSQPSSVVSTPIGIMFQTSKGIYLLGRDRQVSYIGAPVEAFNDQTVRGAALMPDRTQVLFVCDSGRSLLYDYFFQQWSTFTVTGLGVVVAGGVSHVLLADGRVFRETPGAYFDGTSQVTLQLETAWYKFSDALQGFQLVYHLYALGQRDSAHQLSMEYQTDYVNQWSAPFTIDARTDDGTAYGDGAYGDGAYGGTPSSAYQYRWHLCLPCEAIRFRFSDIQDAGVSGKSFELTELLLTGGVKSNVIRPFPAGKQA